MVSKVTVVALVAIIAVPIFLGYAFNFTETTETEYRTVNDTVNTTQLLQNADFYNVAHMNSYQLNTNFTMLGLNQDIDVLPIYNEVNSTKSSMVLNQFTYTQGTHTAQQGFQFWHYFYIQSDDDVSGGWITATVKTSSNVVLLTINRMHSLYWDETTGNLDYTYYTTAGSAELTAGRFTITDTSQYVAFTDSGVYNGNFFIEGYLNTVAPESLTYINFAAGFYLRSSHYPYSLNLPQTADSLVISVDLSSITMSNYSFTISDLIFKKTAGVWTAGTDPSDMVDIYYDSSRSSNTYQIKYWIDTVNNKAYTDLCYVGDWPTQIGMANTFMTYSFEDTFTADVLNAIEIDVDIAYNDRTPTMRFDDGTYQAFQFKIIENVTYTPYSFRNNPATTISNVQKYGTSINFGLIEYPVTDGKITLGSKQIPVNGLVFSSTPNTNGGYDNKIGNTIVSTTIGPSAIYLRGQWDASVSTQSMESYTYTSTEWKAGEFAWDGIDHNFLIVGLITCLGVFIGCGIYARRSRSGGIIPLMIVTGCAAFVFFIML